METHLGSNSYPFRVDRLTQAGEGPGSCQSSFLLAWCASLGTHSELPMWPPLPAVLSGVALHPRLGATLCLPQVQTWTTYSSHVPDLFSRPQPFGSPLGPDLGSSSLALFC